MKNFLAFFLSMLALSTYVQGLTVSAIPLNVTSQRKASLLVQQGASKSSRLTANDHVDRGLFLVKPHIIRGLSKEKIGGLRNISIYEDKLRYAIREFELAIKQKEELVGYELVQVYAHLANTYEKLAIELHNRPETQERKGVGHYTGAAKQALQQSVTNYRLALQSDPGSLEYHLAQELVIALIILGENDQALSAIQEFERKGLAPEQGLEHGLIRLKADAQLRQGKTKEAALTYEEWIKKGSVKDFLTSHPRLYKQLVSLKELTGHPANLNETKEASR